MTLGAASAALADQMRFSGRMLSAQARDLAIQDFTESLNAVFAAELAP
jgi:hypothetical protein